MLCKKQSAIIIINNE